MSRRTNLHDMIFFVPRFFFSFIVTPDTSMIITSHSIWSLRDGFGVNSHCHFTTSNGLPQLTHRPFLNFLFHETLSIANFRILRTESVFSCPS